MILLIKTIKKAKKLSGFYIVLFKLRFAIYKNGDLKNFDKDRFNIFTGNYIIPVITTTPTIPQPYKNCQIKTNKLNEIIGGISALLAIITVTVSSIILYCINKNSTSKKEYVLTDYSKIKRKYFYITTNFN